MNEEPVLSALTKPKIKLSQVYYCSLSAYFCGQASPDLLPLIILFMFSFQYSHKCEKNTSICYWDTSYYLCSIYVTWHDGVLNKN